MAPLLSRFMRAIGVTFCVVFAACMPTHAQTPHTSVAADLESKTVALVASRGGEARAYCSGVWVSATEILTANHCVDELEEGDRVAYVTREDLSAQDGDEVEAVRFGALAARDDAHDLALVRVKFAPVHATAAIASSVSVGELVQSMGHPLGLWWSYSSGFVSAVRVINTGLGDAWFVQSTAPISPGNSGGGLFNADGDLVGVCHAYMPRGENVNLYIDARYVRAFLAAVRA